MQHIDSAHFRQVLGQFPTGVVVITAMSPAGEAIGMTVGSFTSVSLDPPLVAFLPSKSSRSWQALQAAGGSFCVNVLAADQEGLCRAVATRPENKFEGFGWRPSASGNPILDDAVAYIDCATEAVHEGGDHDIVVGRVRDLDVVRPGEPLLFFRGGYGSFTPSSLAAGGADLLDQLRLVDLARAHMEQLASELSTEVTAVALVRDELVLIASAGTSDCQVAPTRVGHRVPFAPPLGSIHAAWGGEPLRAHWLSGLDASFPEGYRGVPEIVRSRGLSVTFDHEPNERLETVAAQLHHGVPGVDARSLREAIRNVAGSYNPDTLEFEGTRELRSMAAPVFGADGNVAFALTLWGPQRAIDQVTFDAYRSTLLAAAARSTDALARASIRQAA